MPFACSITLGKQYVYLESLVDYLIIIESTINLLDLTKGDSKLPAPQISDEDQHIRAAPACF